MPRGIYSTRFLFGSLNTALGFTRTYTVPVGKVAVIRAVGFDFLTGAATADVSLTPSPGGVAARFLRYTLAATDTVTGWDGRLVCNAGDVITATNRTAGSTNVVVYVSGYLLTV